jgi:prepilin-type N-terminal cleavage/methylation domain-containing protein
MKNQELFVPMKFRTQSKRRQQGFTLIELSIVLVIIGLIVGGVLVGQDLIKAAEIRATISQVEKYNASVNTFRTKYNGMPGDLTADNANAFGFVTRTGSPGRGDGNGLIDTSTGSGTVFGQEPALFWNDLSVANLVDGSFTGIDSASPIATTTSTVSTVMPPAKLGRGNYITVGSTGGLNYYLLAGITGTSASSGAYQLNMNLTPIQAYNIDVKLDDGLPLTGTVQARGTAASGTSAFTDGTTWSSSSNPQPGDCATTGSSGVDPVNTYNRGLNTGGNAPACILRFRFN